MLEEDEEEKKPNGQERGSDNYWRTRERVIIIG